MLVLFTTMRSTLGRALLRSAGTVRRPHTTTMTRIVVAFSTEAAPMPAFQYEKSKELFERITQKCSKEEIPLLANEIMKILGRTFRKNEFYYSGFGGRRVKGGAAEAEAAPVVQEAVKLTVDLKLAGFDASAKIKVIKEIRAITGLGLKEAKDLVESAPKVIQKDIKKEEAEALKAKLVEIGAEIELV